MIIYCDGKTKEIKNLTVEPLVDAETPCLSIAAEDKDLR